MTCCLNIVSPIFPFSPLPPIRSHNFTHALTPLPTVPVKYEHVVFCSLSPFQESLYKFFVSSPAAQALLKGKDSQPLKAITLLRKLCNHPDLLNFENDLPGAESVFPEEYDPNDRRRKLEPAWSGKMAVLERLVNFLLLPFRLSGFERN